MILENINNTSDIKSLSIKQLKTLAQEIRDYMFSVVPLNGGHLASNLGVVELTLALIYVFDFPNDKIVWDVGHQSYVYKILTGRKDAFKTIRCEGGISGFPQTSESEYDFFNTGHSSTSVSAALGMARVRDLENSQSNIISVIGDGALTGGMAFEALNDLGSAQTRLLVVLNDNEMSISKNVGGMSRYLSRIRVKKSYTRFKHGLKTIVRCVPLVGKPLYKFLDSSKDRLKMSVIKGRMFEQLGLNYVGPIDGHNIKYLIGVLESCKQFKKPILLHAVTKKGKGYDKAEENPTIYHGIQPCQQEKKASFSLCAGETVTRLAESNSKIIAITAAMKEGTGLTSFASRFPKRFYDVGIAEQHAATMSAGLAISGYKPYFFVYSSFLQRAYDQVLHDVCLQNLPVTFCLDRAGVSESDGATHQGLYDMSYLRSMPNMTIIAPLTPKQLTEALELSEGFNAPLAIRYPRDCVLTENDFVKDSRTKQAQAESHNKKIDSHSNMQALIQSENEEILFEQLVPLQYGKWQTIHDSNSDIWIVAAGDRMLSLVRGAATLLNNKNIKINIVNACFIKPIDIELVYTIASTARMIICLEDGVELGGLYSAILEQIEKLDIKKRPKTFQLALPDKVINNLSVDSAFRENGISAEVLADRIMSLL